MSDAAKPEPGWYAALLSANGEVMRVGPLLDDAMRDAERYRWLRRNAEDIECRTFHWIGPGTVERYARDLDAAIDAEIAREKETS